MSDEPRTVALPDGRWVEVSTYPADLGGGLVEGGRPSRIVVVRDVTRARDAEAAREAFLGVLSHELRTPVTTIFGYAKVLQRSARREDRDEMLADIEVEADRLYRIVEDLLALSRVEGGITSRASRCSSSTSPGRSSPRRPSAGARIHFETDLPSGLPRSSASGRTWSRSSGTSSRTPASTARPARASRSPRRRRPDEVLVRVLDRGRGVETDEAERLFELYYRSPARPATRPAPASGCTSDEASSRPWAAGSGRGRGLAVAPSSGSACRAATRTRSRHAPPGAATEARPRLGSR